MLVDLINQYANVDCRDLGTRQLEQLRNGLKSIHTKEIQCFADGKAYLELLRKFREAVAESDKLHGTNYPKLLENLLSVGEDGVYSNRFRFIFELIQNVDDCDYPSPNDCSLDMRFDFNEDKIILTYNEVGFTPFNVFAITGIAEAAKNIDSKKNEIGEKGIGFKSVFGEAEKVLIKSGWFAFELHKENFTIPVPAYSSEALDLYRSGTQMVLSVPGRAQDIYKELKRQYCQEDALFSKNPLLFLNKLTSLKMYFDQFRSMEFHVSRTGVSNHTGVTIERDVEVSVKLRDHDNGQDTIEDKIIHCSRYSYPVVFSKKACESRYGKDVQVSGPTGKPMTLRIVFPNPTDLSLVGNGSLYSFLPTQLKLSVPIVFHVPFKLDASREFVDPQNNNRWFEEACRFLSESLDFAYQDWKLIVRENIVNYLPGVKENLFAQNNGKERCLRDQEDKFAGRHFLDLPLFLATDGVYYPANEVLCFSPNEKIRDPQKVYTWIGYKNPLFLSPTSPSKFGFIIKKDVLNELFWRLLSDPTITSEALEYLTSEKFEFTKKLLEAQGNLSLTTEQVKIIFRHEELAKQLRNVACNSVEKGMQLFVALIDGQKQGLMDVLGEDFEENGTSEKVERYLIACKETCFCLNIGENNYLPCRNGVVLSTKNTVDSFAEFCRAIDPEDTFATRMKLSSISRKLDQCVEEKHGSASHFLQSLRNFRAMIRTVLGPKSYKSYVELIQKASTDSRERYLQEILQNADDCEYAPGVSPSFSLTQRGNTIITEYNETGFTRADIRSITAIGESTKNTLLSSEKPTIGEKGVGFKSIFAVAAKVEIQSGEFAFGLTSDEPTIPKRVKMDCGDINAGTRMIITLKDGADIVSYREKEIVQLCLCLRKLKFIKIGNYDVNIEDSPTHRTITVLDDAADNKASMKKSLYVFRRFTHSFQVSNENALAERQNENRSVSANQRIVCFVPENGRSIDCVLYNGLPTKHQLNIPMIFDAPFSLTTSREYIDRDTSSWNNYVRKEMYAAIVDVIEALKVKERSKIFRFIKYSYSSYRDTRNYSNITFKAAELERDYLNAYNFIDDLKNRAILPTFDKSVFSIPTEKDAFLYPEPAKFIFRNVSSTDYEGIYSSMIIDVGNKEYEAALHALGCTEAPFEQVFPVIEKYAGEFIRNDHFRESLYEYLKECPLNYVEKIRALPIIPVYGQSSESVKYIAWEYDRIFVKKATTISNSNYYILNENIMSKSLCEELFDGDISEMTKTTEQARYNNYIREKLQNESDMSKVYRYLLSEYRKKALQRNDSFSTLRDIARFRHLPLKNALGEITKAPLFLCNQPEGYFPTKMLLRLIPHKECAELAKNIYEKELKHIHYDEIGYMEILTADDVECLRDDYFVYSEELLRGFWRDGLISHELINYYNLDRFVNELSKDDDMRYDFPSDPVKNRSRIQKRASELWQDASEIVDVCEWRKVKKGKAKDGSLFALDSRSVREKTLRKYTPEDAYERCCCQMCGHVKPYSLMEVNNIEFEPTHFLAELRVSLCLDCSKLFESLRADPNIRNAFLEAIKNKMISSGQGVVEIPIGYKGNERTVRFTATHLAEIQEILLQKPKAAPTSTNSNTKNEGSHS